MCFLKRGGEYRLFLLFTMLYTVHFSNSSCPRKGIGHFLWDILQCPQRPGDRNVHDCLFRQTIPLPWLHLAACLPHPRSSQALAQELKAPGHTRVEQPRQSCSWHQGKLFAPRGKHSSNSVHSINSSLLCYKRPYCRNTNHSEMACTMSNHLKATGHPLGTGPKLDSVCNLLTGGRQGREHDTHLYSSPVLALHTMANTHPFKPVDNYNRNRHEDCFDLWVAR